MTVPVSTGKAGPYTGNGVATSFTFDFKVLAKADLRVVLAVVATGAESDLVLDSDYSVTLNPDQDADPGGSITYPLSGDPMASTRTLTIIADLDVSQPTDITNSGGFYPNIIEAALDRIVMLVRQLAESVSRALKLAVSTPDGVSPELPVPVPYALIGWNAAGDGFQNADPTYSTALATDLASSAGASLVGFIQSGANSVATAVQDELRKNKITPQQFGAKGGGVHDDTDAFAKMFADGRAWYIPYASGGYLISDGLVVTSSGVCDGQLIAAANFVGTLITICNPIYGKKLVFTGLDTYSTDVRPNPYGVSSTTGIYVGPTATFAGNTPCPGVLLINCRAQRFSYGLHISSFNITVLSGAYFQNDHNILIYSTDTTLNQVNDVSLINVQADSAATSTGSVAYALRVGTTGEDTYTGVDGMGTNLTITGCDFDGAPVYIDNVYGVDYRSNYHEQGDGYSYTGGAVVLGSAGAGYLRGVHISGPGWFRNFDYAIDVINQVSGLTIDPLNYASIKYSAVRLGAAQTQTFKYRNGVPLGNTDWSSGKSEVLTNFSSGISSSQLTFSTIQIENDYLTNGVQVAPGRAYTTNWYPNGITNDGWKQVASTVGRFRSGSAAQTGITGTQSGSTFTFDTASDALKFNGGDRITSSAGSASFIKSVDYAAGTAVLDSTYTGAPSISHVPAVFLGVSLSGSGSPEGVIAAIPGSFYLDTTGAMYIKEVDSTSSNWVRFA